jgi:ribosomal protein S27E
LDAARNRSEHGFGYPWFVEREFREFLRCGLLRHGFVRVRCDDCAAEKLVAFSCKRRGICPSCTARRMTDTAAHLADNVFAKVPHRQCASLWLATTTCLVAFWTRP